MSETTIHLISGEPFDYTDPFAAEITPHDVAHPLARISRYGGHCIATWSVAQHSLLVFQLVVGWYKEVRHGLGALNHDDAEFVTGDWPTPMKAYVQTLGLDFRTIERPIEAAVCRQLGVQLDELHAGVVKDADNVAYEIEIAHLKPAGAASREQPDEDLLMYGGAWFRTLAALEVEDVEAVWLTIHEAGMRNG